MSVDRKAVRQRIDQIRQVLLADWDPLQVDNNRMLADEYDFCLARVIKVLDSGDAERIVDVLIQIEEDLGMASEDNRAALLPVAQRLLALTRA